VGPVVLVICPSNVVSVTRVVSTPVSLEGDESLLELISRRIKNPTRTAITATTMLSVELKF